jgi:hypothetical protein
MTPAKLLAGLSKDRVLKFEIVQLPAPYPNHKIERKYKVNVLSEGDEIIEVGAFFAVRKTTNYVFKLGITLPEGSDWNEASRYALSYMSGATVTACLGMDLTPEMIEWSISKLNLSESRTKGTFKKNFGDLEIVAGFAPLGFVALALTRSGKPGGKNWSSQCTI